MAERSRSPRRLHPNSRKPAKPAKLTKAELTGLRTRIETMTAQKNRAAVEARLADMAEESYATYSAGLAEKYGLPKKFDVDVNTGEIVDG